MELTITPGSPLRGEVSLPGDKSLSHRAALLAALAEGQSRVENFLVSGVTQAMLSALTALGVPWSLDGTTLTVSGLGLGGLRPAAAALDCGNSATTLRLLAGALAAAGIPGVLTGTASLRRRPMQRIVEPLLQMGVQVATENGCAPLSFQQQTPGFRLHAVDYVLPVASAQVKSCLLLAGLAADGSTCLSEPGPSRDHTERMLGRMGVTVASQEIEASSGQKAYLTVMEPLQAPLRPLNLRLPGDFSSAAFLIIAAAVTPGSEVILRGVGLNPLRTGLLQALAAMGADLHLLETRDAQGEPYGDLLVRCSRLHGTRVAGDLVVRMIDEFPAFAIAAAYANGETTVNEAVELRHKESDRISALCAELRCLGVQAQELPDGFSIWGGQPAGGGRVRAVGDHRLAMALAVAGLAAAAPVTVAGAEIMAESFPGFVEVLAGLGANVALVEGS